MADNKKAKGNPDRSTVSGNETYELSYLEEKFGVTRQEAKAAIAAVGKSRKKVEEYLRSQVIPNKKLSG